MFKFTTGFLLGAIGSFLFGVVLLVEAPAESVCNLKNTIDNM